MSSALRLGLFSRFSLLVSCAVCCTPAPAGSPFGFLEDFDLNDYAFGLGLSAREQPYAGVDAVSSLYPFLTNVEDSTLTKHAFVARNGTYGLRTVRDSGLEIGVFGRVETLGFGADPDPPLDELDPVGWTVEVGPSLGWRRGFLQPDLAIRKGIAGGHNAWVGEMSLSIPLELRNGYIVPFASLNYRGEEYIDHYFEQRPLRPADTSYESGDLPSTAVGYTFGVRAGYRLSKLWILTGSLSLETLDEDLARSALVSERHTFGATLGVAYNRSVFAAQNVERMAEADHHGFALRAYGLQGSISGEYVLPTPDVGAGPGMEGTRVGLSDNEIFGRVEAVVELPRRHRLEGSFARMTPQGTYEGASLDNPANRTPSSVTSDSRFYRIAYGYSLLRSTQKEAGVLVGISYPDLRVSLRDEDGQTVYENELATPFFTCGAYGRVSFRRSISAQARVEVGGLTLGQNEGTVGEARLLLSWMPFDSSAVIAGYEWQLARVESYSDTFQGELDQRFHGPFIGLELSF